MAEAVEVLLEAEAVEVLVQAQSLKTAHTILVVPEIAEKPAITELANNDENKAEKAIKPETTVHKKPSLRLNPIPKLRQISNPMNEDDEIRINVIHLLRIYFTKDGETPDPLDDTKELKISLAHIQILAETILVTSDIDRYPQYWVSTRDNARIILTNSITKFKLPDSILTMVAYRFDGLEVEGTEISRIAKDIILSAKQNRQFWDKKRANELHWGYVHPSRLQGSTRRGEDWQQERTRNISGWVPATIHPQRINVDNGSYRVFGTIVDRWDQYRLNIILDGHRNSRELPLSGIQLMPLESSEGHIVELLYQDTWIYTKTNKLQLLPQTSTRTSYIKLTINTYFPESVGCMFFAERTMTDSPFREFPRPRMLIIDEDTPAPEAAVPVAEIQNVYLGTDQTCPLFIEEPHTFPYDFDDWLIQRPSFWRAIDAAEIQEEQARLTAVEQLQRQAYLADDEEEDDEEDIVVPALPVPINKSYIKYKNQKLPKRIYEIITHDFISKGEECSIAMEPVTHETIAITSCFHIFTKDAIQRWIQTESTCPQCRAEDIFVYSVA